MLPLSPVRVDQLELLDTENPTKGTRCNKEGEPDE
jgi:hypothetical protein